MGRRSDHSREEIRQMALEAALRLLESEGDEALTTRRIASEIGYAPGTLYNVFEDLDDLKVHVNAAAMDVLRADLVEARKKVGAGEDEKPVDTVMALARVQRRFMEQRPALWRQLFSYWPADDRPFPPWYRQQVVETVSELEHALAPVFPDDAATRQTYARALWASFFGICEIASRNRLQLIAPNEVEPLTKILVEACLQAAGRTNA